MALNDSALQVGSAAIAADITHASFHTADPGAAGTTAVIAGGRVPIDLDAVNGDLSLATPAAKTGLTPGAAVAFLGLWTASTGGTYRGSAQRTSGDENVNASGEYTIDALTIPVSSS